MFDNEINEQMLLNKSSALTDLIAVKLWQLQTVITTLSVSSHRLNFYCEKILARGNRRQNLKEQCPV